MEEKKKANTNKPNKGSNGKKTVKKTTSKPVAKNSNKSNVKKVNTAKKNVEKKSSNVSKVETTKPEVKEVSKVNLEPKETKVQENVEFPVNKYTSDGVKNAKDVQNTLIFSAPEKENISDVVNELKFEKDEKNIEIPRSVARRNAIIVIAVLMVALVFITGCGVISSQKKINKDNKPKEEEKFTINNNVYDKIVANSKNRDDQLSSNDKEEKPKEEPVAEENEYSNIKYITLNEFEAKILLHEPVSVLVSSSTCYYCLTYEPVLNEELNKLNKEVYRLNVSKMSSTERNTLQEYYTVTTTPTIFHVDESGVVDSDLVGIKEAEDVSEWFQDK